MCIADLQGRSCLCGPLAVDASVDIAVLVFQSGNGNTSTMSIVVSSVEVDRE